MNPTPNPSPLPRTESRSLCNPWSVLPLRQLPGRLQRIALALAVAISAFSAWAEESGIGHYNPGQTADFIDALPGFPSFAYMNIFTFYKGSAGGSQQFPISGGRLAVGIDAESYTDSSVFLWETPYKILGGYYTVFASVPYTWLTVSANVQTGTKTGQTKQSVNGIGDMYFAPAAIGWTNGDFKWDTRFGIYAPTGEYEATRLANQGLGFWTFEPEVTFSWISSKIGTEVSAFAGVDFNTENTESRYTSGDVFHVDLTVAQHLPLLGGIVGVGANGFYIQQITGDSGPGAAAGSFLQQELGVGPVISYIKKMGKTELAINVKWLPQMDVQNTMKGDYIWVKAAVVF